MKLLTIDDVARMFGKKRKTIDNWLYTGTLPRNLTVKIKTNVFFIEEKLNDHIAKLYEEQQKG